MEDAERNYMIYEYKEVITESKAMKRLLDGYTNFGWELEKEVTRNINERTIRISSPNLILQNPE